MMVGPTKKFSRFFSVERLDMHQKSEGDYRAVTGSPSPLFVQQWKDRQKTFQDHYSVSVFMTPTEVVRKRR
jgi:hypothetical protein